ncbi:ROK family transcriptional regulator [Aestuariimicrobium ganziense]|uniref:ROK family transcriptional regulator n=1 Tax=Aestuariimicrobium ganziense TaxID=2773677 RepID=UPI0019420738|nr:ROK family protein [Aestuariimicrobium ganziense]
MIKRSARTIRNESRFSVLKAMLSRGEAMTRHDLARATTLSAATVANVVTELLEAGVLQVESRSSVVGRPSANLTIAPHRAYLVGVDVAETYVRAEVFDLTLNALGASELALDDRDDSPDHVIAGVATAVRRAMKTAGVPEDRIGGLGISLPGHVLPSTGVSVFAPNWAWHGVKFRELVEPELDLPVTAHVDNPLKAVALAEMWLGSSAPDDDFAVVNLGTGVGVGFVLGGRLVRGSTNSAGEWGHTTLVMDGRRCRCGRRGCIEAYIGARGMRQTLAEVAPGHRLVSLGQADFVAGYAAGLALQEPEMVEALGRTAHHLAVGLGDLINFLDPDRLVLTGWTFRQLSTWLLPATCAILTEQALPSPLGHLEVVAMDLPGNPVTLGMAVCALEDFLAQSGVPGRHQLVSG